MSICTLIYDHLAVVSTKFCLRLCCCFFGEVVVKVLTVSPGSENIAMENAHFPWMEHQAYSRASHEELR